MSPEGKQIVSETTTDDSPAFRLRPRAEPKSYYTIRLEYSANPAAFTRERPRSTKRRSVSSSQKSSYSRSKNQSGGGGGGGGGGNSRSAAAASSAHRQALLNNRFPNGQTADLNKPQLPHVPTKEELEREEKRKQLQREIAKSITTDTPVSPFMQHLDLNELKSNTTYRHNYITLRIESVEIKDQTINNVNSIVISSNSDRKCLNCKCFGVDNGTLSPSNSTGHDNEATPQSQIYLNVQLHDQYANDNLIKKDKIINIGKFKTGPPVSGPLETHWDSGNFKELGFDVIVNYDDCNTESNLGRPLIPFISVTDAIEKPTDPYVEVAPSPVNSSDVKPTFICANNNELGLKVNVCAGTIPPPIVQTSAPKVELEDVIVDHESKKLRLSIGVASVTTAATTASATNTHNQQQQQQQQLPVSLESSN